MKATKDIQTQIKLDMSELGINQNALATMLKLPKSTISYELNKTSEDRSLLILQMIHDMKKFAGIE